MLLDPVALKVSNYSRRRKVAAVEAVIPKGVSLLMVGLSNPSNSSVTNQVEIALAQGRDAVGLFYPPLKDLRRKLGFEVVRGDGSRLPFADNSFDYVFSNAVIEHVGDEADQQRYFDESRRVARCAVFHTTPHRWSPVETHTKTFFVHWLPRRLHQRLFARSAYRWQSTDRLLSRREVRRLAGPGSKVTSWPPLVPLTITAVQSAHPSAAGTPRP
ncbi:MAG: methyltransferase domain-containing protein [Mycobacteriales bacterium]|nr:methyltransferase domain-containing protein [Mycobacteriales bacterium]